MPHINSSAYGSTLCKPQCECRRENVGGTCDFDSLKWPPTPCVSLTTALCTLPRVSVESSCKAGVYPRETARIAVEAGESAGGAGVIRFVVTFPHSPLACAQHVIPFAYIALLAVSTSLLASPWLLKAKLLQRMAFEYESGGYWQRCMLCCATLHDLLSSIECDSNRHALPVDAKLALNAAWVQCLSTQGRVSVCLGNVSATGMPTIHAFSLTVNT